MRSKQFGRGAMRRTIPVTLTACLLLLGCTATHARAQFRPTLKWGKCPADVEATFVSKHKCGYLTVLEDRSKPTGGTVRLLVAKVPPVGVPARRGIGTAVGSNVGDADTLSGGIAEGTTRLQRVNIQAEQRGSGHSRPSLRCPETDALQARAAGARTGDISLTMEFAAAVKACATRLRAAGVKLEQYDSAASAADLEDLRTASGVHAWAFLGSYGTRSRTLFEYLRRYPGHTRAAYLDSPWFPEIDDLTGGATGTRAVLQAMFDACAADPSCAHTYPHLQLTWQRALVRLAKTPIRGTGFANAGTGVAIVPVLVDAGKLLRMARFTLGGDGPDNLTLLPSFIKDAAAGKLTPELGSLVANDPIFCAGYRPACVDQGGFSLGVYLSTFCRDELPFINRATLTAAVGDDPVYRAVFTNSPYLAACKAWAVAPSPTAPHRTTSRARQLLMSGQFDSFSSPAVTSAEAARLAHAWPLVIPGQTHNVLGFNDCVIGIRNQWTFAPTRPPESRTCTDTPAITFR
jgi:pimeloyl-ACP methyl ester carboxylesterase